MAPIFRSRLQNPKAWSHWLAWHPVWTVKYEGSRHPGRWHLAWMREVLCRRKRHVRFGRFAWSFWEYQIGMLVGGT
jgi:hypothetical protein